MKYALILFFCLFASIDTFAEAPEVSKKFNNKLSKYYNSESIKKEKIDELCRFNDLVYKTSEGEKELGLVVLTSAKGRYEKFDYMIVYNLEFEIEHIEVLTYRSAYGSEITAKRWLKQFYNKSTDYLKYGSDIQAISGATFSAISLTRNVNRINKIINEYAEKNN